MRHFSMTGSEKAGSPGNRDSSARVEPFAGRAGLVDVYIVRIAGAAQQAACLRGSSAGVVSCLPSCGTAGYAADLQPVFLKDAMRSGSAPQAHGDPVKILSKRADPARARARSTSCSINPGAGTALQIRLISIKPCSPRMWFPERILTPKKVAP